MGFIPCFNMILNRRGYFLRFGKLLIQVCEILSGQPAVVGLPKRAGAGVRPYIFDAD
jgi:hypothetical protein